MWNNGVCSLTVIISSSATACREKKDRKRRAVVVKAFFVTLKLVMELVNWETRFGYGYEVGILSNNRWPSNVRNHVYEFEMLCVYERPRKDYLSWFIWIRKNNPHLYDTTRRGLHTQIGIHHTERSSVSVFNHQLLYISKYCRFYSKTQHVNQHVIVRRIISSCADNRIHYDPSSRIISRALVRNYLCHKDFLRLRLPQTFPHNSTPSSSNFSLMNVAGIIFPVVL